MNHVAINARAVYNVSLQLTSVGEKRKTKIKNKKRTKGKETTERNMLALQLTVFA